MERIIYWVVSKKSEGRSPFCEVTPKIVRGGLLMAFFEVFLRFHSQTWGPIVLHLLLLACCCLFLLIYLQKNSKLFQFFTTESKQHQKTDVFLLRRGSSNKRSTCSVTTWSSVISACFLLTENVIFFLKKKVYLNLKEANFLAFFLKIRGFLWRINGGCLLSQAPSFDSLTDKL